jgi:hypothetical protein
MNSIGLTSEVGTADWHTGRHYRLPSMIPVGYVTVLHV